MQSIELLARLPLAEGVFALWRQCLPQPQSTALYEQHRGRCYSKAFSFGQVVQLLADAVCQYGGSGRSSYEHAAEAAPLPGSVQAMYAKFRRMPLAVSAALVADGSVPLRQLYPAAAQRSLPPCVCELDVLIVDGKAIKRVAKRLKVMRGRAGGVLGGRALVGLSMRTGLAVAMAAHPDGEINDVRLVPELVAHVRQQLGPPRLWVADRGFCDLKQPGRFAAGGDHFLVRQHRKLSFRPDAQQPVRRGADAAGRAWVEDWGWIGATHDLRRRAVRRIRLRLSPRAELVLLTDLVAAERYPAAALLELYRQRWGIEQVFQQVTEVFGLKGLIGSSPQASVFQLAFCLVLNNLIQVLRGYVAAGNARQCDEVSVEKLFEDVQRELIAWSVLGSVAATVDWLAHPLSVAQLRRRLRQRVGGLWRERWKKSPPQKRKAGPAPPGNPHQHTSVYRLLQQYSQLHQGGRRHEQ